ncbi:MAG: FHA domain-containing protein [Armatimonadota bacterium]|nr:FHA domain-containing protein [Armatimonadota bacterium]MCX7777815.1 FHA domain-containing protein [Armatimonadota bacterium]MDW8025929.1 FHA domain-containing protein [Armatimonadota bacterium]
MFSWLRRLFAKEERKGEAEQLPPGELEGEAIVERVELEAQPEQPQARGESITARPPEATAGAARPYLELAGDDGRTLPIEGDVVTVGRGEGCQLRVDESYPHHESVSEQHAQIEFWHGMWVIKDLTGKGVFVNGRRTGENVLRDGYRIKLGELEFIFREV